MDKVFARHAEARGSVHHVEQCHFYVSRYDIYAILQNSWSNPLILNLGQNVYQLGI